MLYYIDFDYECLLNLFGGVFKKKRIVSRARALALNRNFLKFLPFFRSSSKRGVMGGLPPHSISNFLYYCPIREKGKGYTFSKPSFFGGKIPPFLLFSASEKPFILSVSKEIKFKKKELEKWLLISKLTI